MQKNEVYNSNPGWNLSRNCIYNTLMAKRTGGYTQNQFCRILYNITIQNLRKTQLAKFDGKYIAGRIFKMQESKKQNRIYEITIHETSTYTIKVTAKNFEEAIQSAEAMVADGGIDILRPDCNEIDYFATCDRCGMEFGEYDGREVDTNTPMAKLLCDRCNAHDENNGILTRCEKCDATFSPQFLETNPENGESEICPYCKTVWCD